VFSENPRKAQFSGNVREKRSQRIEDVGVDEVKRYVLTPDGLH
jgi:hypothetical protein